MAKTKKGYETEGQLRRAISTRLVALRVHMKYQPADVRRLTGIPRSTLRKYEDGTLPTPLRMIMLARLYNCSLDFLMTGNGPGQISVVYGDHIQAPAVKPRVEKQDLTPKPKSAKAKSSRTDKHGTRKYDFEL